MTALLAGVVVGFVVAWLGHMAGRLYERQARVRLWRALHRDAARRIADPGVIHLYPSVRDMQPPKPEELN